MFTDAQTSVRPGSTASQATAAETPVSTVRVESTIPAKKRKEVIKGYIKAISKNRAEVIKLLNAYEFPTAKNTSTPNLDKKVRSAIRSHQGFARQFAALTMPDSIKKSQAGESLKVKQGYNTKSSNFAVMQNADGPETDPTVVNSSAGTNETVVINTGGVGLTSADAEVASDPATDLLKQTLAEQTADDKIVTIATAQEVIEKESQLDTLKAKYPLAVKIVTIAIVIAVGYFVWKKFIKKY